MDILRTFDIPKRSNGRPNSDPLKIRQGETEVEFCLRQQLGKKRQRIYKDSLDLSKKEESLREELCEKLWVAMYLQHFVKRLMPKEEVKIVKIVLFPGAAPRPPFQTRSSRPSPGETLETYSALLAQRKRDALIGKEGYWNSLHALADVLKLNVEGQPENAHIAFRFFITESNSPYFESTGDFRCGNWKDFDIRNPTYSIEAKKHIVGSDRSAPTNYISISTSPGRVWNYMQDGSRGVKTNVHKSSRIAVIDLRVLERLGIAYGSTTDDLKFQHRSDNSQTGTIFATKHHCLVLGWIPRQCILGFLSIENFKILLDASAINPSKNAPLSEFEKKISFAAMEMYFGVQEQVELSIRQRADR